MELFRYVTQSKVAGRSVSEDPSTWTAEVIRAAKNDHPYLSLEEAKVELQDVSPTEKRAKGAIIFKNGSGVLFSIRPEPMRGKPELDGLDVLFDRGRFRHLNENSYRESMTDSTAGRQADRNPDKNWAQPGNNNAYVGSVTGDVSPLSAKNTPTSLLGGPAMMSARVASCLTGKFITNEELLSRLEATLSHYNGLSRAATIYGIRDSILADGRSNIAASVPDLPGALTITRDGMRFTLHFPSGDARTTSAYDLKRMLGEQFSAAMRTLLQHNCVTVAGVDTALESVDLDSLKVMMPAISTPGTYQVNVGNDNLTMYVSPQIQRLDGTAINKQIAVNKDGAWASEALFYGVTMPDETEPVALPYAPTGEREEGIYGSKSLLTASVGGVLGRMFNPMLSREEKARRMCRCGDEHVISYYAKHLIDPPSKCVIFQFANGLLSTPLRIVTVQEVYEATSGGVSEIWHCRDLISDQKCALAFVSMLARPMRSESREGSLAGLEGDVYLIPDEAIPHYIAPERLDIKVNPSGYADTKLDRVKMARLDVITYALNNELITNRPQFLAKAAAAGVGGMAMERAMHLAVGEEFEVGVQPKQTTKRATLKESERAWSATRQLLKGAAELAEGADAITKTQPDALDAPTIDSILALQFASPDNMAEIVSSKGQFEEVEDKIARLLLASRDGIEHLSEEGLTRALRGMGEVHKAIQSLKMELEVEGVL